MGIAWFRLRLPPLLVAKPTANGHEFRFYRGSVCLSKAIRGRALALELAQDGRTVNGISPGPFATEMNIPLMENPDLNRQFLAAIPLGRWGDPKNIGQLALFLCSDDAGFITGTDIVVDGGWTAQ